MKQISKYSLLLHRLFYGGGTWLVNIAVAVMIYLLSGNVIFSFVYIATNIF